MVAVSLRNGDVDPAVAEVRQRLARLGIIENTSSSKDDVFDTELGEAVRIFQQSRGLTVDGIVGPQTFRRLEEARWLLGDRVLSYLPGKMIHGEDVASLQRKLQDLGFHLDRIDGVFGPQTDKAVREFQRSVGISDDGICGPDVFTSFARLTRTVTGGSQEHLRELARLDGMHTVESATIVIDPSSDQSMLQGCDTSIAQVCWDVASRLEGRLSAMGSLVIMSRSQDGEQTDERMRATLANENNVDLVISLTMDKYFDEAANGVASYYFGHQLSQSAVGMRLADLVQQEISNRTFLRDCRSHAKTWDLLRLTKMPSVRVELGYATNSADSQILANADQRDAIANALALSISRVLAVKIG